MEKLNLKESCIEKIIQIIDVENRKIENRELLGLCENLGSILKGTIDSHFCHEIAEVALNELVKRKYARQLLTGGNQVEKLNRVLEPITNRLPTQTWRSRRQSALQQFSTPPAIAFLLVYLLNPGQSEQLLEPSAGTGSLAIWASSLGAKIYTNEIDAERNSLLSLLGFEPTSFDAEFINDYLPLDARIDCVLMNPPFSTSGGRTKNNSSKFGFRHVESALERLNKGGKFGIILGEAGGLDAKTGSDFWRKLSDRIKIKSIIKINGREYYKNGTTVDINLITGNKLAETQNQDWSKASSQIISVSARTVEEAFEKSQDSNLRLNQ